MSVYPDLHSPCLCMTHFVLVLLYIENTSHNNCIICFKWNNKMEGINKWESCIFCTGKLHLLKCFLNPHKICIIDKRQCLVHICDLLFFSIFHTLRSIHKVIADQIWILISLALPASLWWQSTEVRHWVRSTISPGMLQGNYSNPHKSCVHHNTPLLAWHDPLLFVLASLSYKEHIL